MNRLSDLEDDLKNRVVPGKEWLVARLDIQHYNELCADEERIKTTIPYDVDVVEIHNLILNNLASALVSPNPYIREWGQFISSRKKRI